ncbi:mercury(II) reductase [Flavilitoribacter nigricans DSM 23189 = NBRC 102662]|uniref:Mercuric reductase n=2 Tax=Flavilitoribacter TaxID=2762562 RepID=A0A2D0N0J7_FLAN2|nr:mercury(II) reductase [Flavilitoribacter nigricans DSM 23189 = NBRC 102662]
MQEVTFEITGMTCDHCAASIEKRFAEVDGMIGKRVSYQEGQGHFTFDPSKLSKETIINTINKGNYRAVGEVESTNRSASSNQYDLIIIGGGSAAFSAAIQANELKLNTLLINGGLPLGGTCVNVGCVPSKHLIRAAEQVHRAAHSPFRGIAGAMPVLDYQTIIRQKKELVSELQQKKYGDIAKRLEFVKVLKGWATFLDPKTVQVGEQNYTAIKFLIATGATTNIPDIEGLEEVGYLTNESLFEQEVQPQSLTIFGAGYIALEIAQAFHRLGSKVRIIHRSERILRSQMADLTDELTHYLQEEGIEIITNVKVDKVERSDSDIQIFGKDADGKTVQFTENGQLAVATGIRPNTFQLGIENTGLELDKKGFIKVDIRQQTNVPHIYAAGDCADTPAFVYTAAKEGKHAVSNAFTGQVMEADYSSLSWVVFTDPQVAGAGMDESEAEAKEIPFETTSLPLSEVPRSQAALDTRGFIKLIRNPETDQLLGARILAPEGGELVTALSLAIKYKIPVSELADHLHPYLTLSEGIKLAAITFEKDVAELSCCAG